MKDSKIIRMLIGLLMGITIFLYPIGTLITNPDSVNNLLDKADIEETTLKLFKEITVDQLKNSSPETQNISQTITDNLIDKPSLRLQRQKSVIAFYESIEKSEVPTIKLDVMNPLAKVKSYFNDTTSSFAQQITDFFNMVLGKEKPTETNKTPAINENLFVIETSLGITSQNINNVNLGYRILKYGPQLLMIVSAGLLLLGYIITVPSTKFAWKMVIEAIKLDISSLLMWWVTPYLFKITNPNLLSFGNANTQPEINGLIGNILFEIAKNALIIPIIFTAITLIAWGLVKLYARAQEADKGFGRYEDQEQSKKDKKKKSLKGNMDKNESENESEEDEE